MKLIFSFTDTPDLSLLSKDDIYQTTFEIPDDALHLIGVEQRILKIAEIVGQLTHASLHITCKELGLKDYLIKNAIIEHTQHKLYFSNILMTLGFSRGTGYINRQFKILSPINHSFLEAYFAIYRKGKDANNLRYRLQPIPDEKRQSLENQQYFSQVKELIDQFLVLLNAEANANWYCLGYHPFWRDKWLVEKLKAIQQRKHKQIQQQQKAEAKRKIREEKLLAKGAELPSTEPPKTGAGRRPGAIPGKFMGVQMRSQLEIRFAAELEKRQIKWVYEVERLSEGNYLVDFYLPDYGAWVEVKGTFEARDEYLLKDVAAYLKKERQQRLFVYTSRKPFLVKPSGFKELTRDEFWEKLLQ